LVAAISEDGEEVLRAWERAQTASMVDLDPLVEAVIAFTSGQELRGNPTEIVETLRRGDFRLPEQGGGKTIARKLRESKATLAAAGVHLQEDAPQGKVRFILFRDPS
jgi:hypothetical protein